MNPDEQRRIDQYVGCLLGTALGDSVGLVCERLSARRIARRWTTPLQQCLVFGYGLISDDTEHAFLTAQSLAQHGQDISRFKKTLAFRLRWWFAAIPAGTGMATARACLRLWCGISPSRSGVWSAGNGPTMRAAIIGLYAAENVTLRAELLLASTVMTHQDPKALTAAVAIAETAAWLVSDQKANLWDIWHASGTDQEWKKIIGVMRQSFDRESSVGDFAQRLGCISGVSGYAYHSVPVTLYAWLQHRQNPRLGLEILIRCGGDTDTTAACAGALYGIEFGPDRLPQDWLAAIVEWPMSIKTLRRGGIALATKQKPVFWWWIFQPIRNAIFLLVILYHGFRRMVQFR